MKNTTMKNLIITIWFIFFILNLPAQSWQKVSAGMEYSMALGVDGTLWAWGFNGNGQLGINSMNPSEDLPVQVVGGNNWLDVSAGAFHCLAMKEDGTLWAWGLNSNGQLGNGNLVQQNSPVQVGSDDDWIYIESGQAHSFAIKENGTLWAWGFNIFGQLGNNSSIDLNEPTQIGNDTDWWMVKAGGGHSLALKADSTLWAWGANFNGQLGTGNTATFIVPTNIGTDNNWIDIDAGFEFSLGVKQGGALLSWGFNENGQLGNGSTTEVNTPQQIADSTNFVSVSAGSAYGLALTENQELFAWGANLFGELGMGNTIQQNNVTQVGMDNDWQSISAAEGGGVGNSVFGFHTLGLRSSEEDICVTGANYTGQLGNGLTDNIATFSCNVGGGLVDAPLLFAETKNIQFYPNPIFDNQFVVIQNQNESLLTLSDLSGKIWLTKNLVGHQNNIECSDLPTGIYLITIRSDDGVFSDKLIKF
jgi:alpha-tubulin suppressor-like RCC1 family protein